MTPGRTGGREAPKISDRALEARGREAAGEEDMAAAGAIIAAASAATGALGSLLGGLASGAEANRQVEAYNQAGDAAMKQARNAAAAERDRFRVLAGSQKAAYGASGVDVNAGSPLDVLADTDATGEVSAMQLLYSGELEKWNNKIQAKSVRRKGDLALLGGILSMATGFAQAGSGLMKEINTSPGGNTTLSQLNKRALSSVWGSGLSSGGFSSGGGSLLSSGSSGIGMWNTGG